MLSEIVGQGVDLSAFWHENELAALLGSMTAVDPATQWAGMPEFDQHDKTAYRTIHVHFANESSVQDFAKLVGQKITERTKYLWFPFIEIETLADKRYREQQPEQDA